MVVFGGSGEDGAGAVRGLVGPEACGDWRRALSFRALGSGFRDQGSPLHPEALQTLPWDMHLAGVETQLS